MKQLLMNGPIVIYGLLFQEAATRLVYICTVTCIAILMMDHHGVLYFDVSIFWPFVRQQY